MFERKNFPGGIIGYRVGRGEHQAMSVWCYRIGSTLIDTTCWSGRRQLMSALEADGPIRRIYVTHHHEDHSGCAALLRRRFGASVAVSCYCSPLTRAGFVTYPYQKLIWGSFRAFQEDDCLPLPPLGELTWSTEDGELVILHVPGHSFDMTAVWYPAAGVLFSADLYLASRIKFARRDEVLPVTLQSIRRILEGYPFRHLLCSHNPVPDRGQDQLMKKAQYLESLTQRVGATAENGLSVRKASTAILGREVYGVQLFTLGDNSGKNLIRSLLGLSRPRPDTLRKVGPEWASCRFRDGSTET